MNQHKKIIRHLSHKGTITNDEARDRYRIRSLTKVISNLRKSGYRISGQWRVDKIDKTNYKIYHVYDRDDFAPIEGGIEE